MLYLGVLLASLYGGAKAVSGGPITETIPVIVNPSLTADVSATGTAQTIKTRSSIPDFDIVFQVQGEDCVNPTLDVKFEEIDYDFTEPGEFFNVLENGNFLQKCTGERRSNCGTFISCLNDRQLLSGNVIPAGTSLTITLEVADDFDALCSNIDPDLAFNVDVTLNCECPPGIIPFSCTRRVGQRVYEQFSSVTCEADEVLVSCGIDGWNNVYGTYIDPASPNQCTVGQLMPLQTDQEPQDGVQPVAVCCTFPADAIESVSTIVSTPGQQVVTTCPADSELTGCQVNLENGEVNNIRGSYAGPKQPFFDTAANPKPKPAQVDTAGIDTLNQCIAEARTDQTEVRGGAQCLKPSCGYELECVTTGTLTSGNVGSTTNFDGNCPADYTLVECSTFTPSNTLDDWHLTSTGGCYVQQDNRVPQYALAVCCKLTEVDENCDDECIEDYNVQIVIDESGSVRAGGYGQSIAFVKKLIENDIKPDTPLSVLSFGSTSPALEFIYKFNDPQNDNRAAILSALDGAEHNGGTTPTRQALEGAIAEYQRAIDDGDLNSGPRILFLITDGVPCCNQAAEPCEDGSGAPDSSIRDQLDALGIIVKILGIGSFSTAPLACLSDDITVSTGGFGPDAFDALEESFSADLCNPDDNFEVVPEPLPCLQAQRYCKENFGTNLATIRTDEDRANAVAALEEAGFDIGWIGLYSDPIETKWQFRSGATCPSASAYKCVDFWLTQPGGGPDDAFRPRCIGPTEGGYECAAFYTNRGGVNGVDNDVPSDGSVALPFLCDLPDPGL